MYLLVKRILGLISKKNVISEIKKGINVVKYRTKTNV